MRHAQLHRLPGRTRRLHESLHVTAERVDGRDQVRRRQRDAMGSATERHLDFGFARDGERRNPAWQQVVQTLLGRAIVQRIETRLTNEFRRDGRCQCLVERKQPCAAQQFVTRTAQHAVRRRKFEHCHGCLVLLQVEMQHVRRGGVADAGRDPEIDQPAQGHTCFVHHADEQPELLERITRRDCHEHGRARRRLRAGEDAREVRVGEVRLRRNTAGGPGQRFQVQLLPESIL